VNPDSPFQLQTASAPRTGQVEDLFVMDLGGPQNETHGCPL